MGLGECGGTPGTEGMERAEFTTEERSQRETNGEEDAVRLGRGGACRPLTPPIVKEGDDPSVAVFIVARAVR